MIIALGSMSSDQKRIAQDVLAQYQLPDEVRLCAAQSKVDAQSLGRDSIEHGARNRARQSLLFIREAKLGLGLEAGIDMTSSGMFLICAAVGRTHDGREAVGWSTPRPIPETVAQGIVEGGSFDDLVSRYRQKWHPSDTISAMELDELIHRHHSFSEALESVLRTLRIIGQ